MTPGLSSQNLHFLTGPGKCQQAFVLLSEGYTLGEHKKQSGDVSVRSCLLQRNSLCKERHVSLSTCCHRLPKGCRCLAQALNAAQVAVPYLAEELCCLSWLSAGMGTGAMSWLRRSPGTTPALRAAGACCSSGCQDPSAQNCLG